MIEYFPRSFDGKKEGANYWPNMLFYTVVENGVTMGDADTAFAPARAAAIAGANDGEAAFIAALIGGTMDHVSRLERQAEQDEQNNRPMSAGEKRLRASAICEHVGWNFWPYSSEDPKTPGRLFRRGRANFLKAIASAGGRHAAVERIAIPYGDTKLDGIYVPAAGGNKNAPVVIHLNGQHSSFQFHYTMRLPEFLADRGIASLLYDCPGTGVALHDQRLGARFDDEVHVAAAIEFLDRRAGGAARPIGLLGGSFGGYRAPRAAAFLPRVQSVVTWPTIYAYTYPGEENLKRLETTGRSPEDYPEFIDTYGYWLGTKDKAEMVRQLRSFTLAGLIPRIRVPILAVHGAAEVQVEANDSERLIREAVNSPRAQLLLVTEELGGAQHCQWDNPAFALAAMADWCAETLNVRSAA